MSQKQVTKTSGEKYHSNLDMVSVMCLADARKLHYSNHGNSFSNSIIIRRALRNYLKHLQSLTDFSMEFVETTRAAKGVY